MRTAAGSTRELLIRLQRAITATCATFGRFVLTVGLAAALMCSSAITADAQIRGIPRPDRMRLSGPRFGFTYLGGAIVDSLKVAETDVAPLITQFGWQWEKQFLSGAGGPVPVTEWVVLVGGLEQGAFLPSLSWLVGLRTENGTEFGVGPNLGPAGFALAVAGGVTRRSGGLNIPINVSVVPSRVGTRVSVLGGFTMR